MPILSHADREYLRQVFAERLVDSVKVRLYTQKLTQLSIPGYECMTCRETNELMGELASLSDKIELELIDLLQAREQAAREEITEIPTIVIEGKNKGRVRFIGSPAGYEFGALVEDLIDVSRGTTALQPLSRQALTRLARPVHIQVFVTPTCPHCPSAARLAHMMAIESDKVTADVIEVGEFPLIAQRYRVHAVPKVVINEVLEFEGARPEHAFIAAIESVAGGPPDAHTSSAGNESRRDG